MRLHFTLPSYVFLLHNKFTCVIFIFLVTFGVNFESNSFYDNKEVHFPAITNISTCNFDGLYELIIILMCMISVLCCLI